MDVVNYPNSFVRFNEPETVSNFRREVQIAHPVYDIDDFHFVFKMTGSLIDISGLLLDPTQIRLGFTLNKTTIIRDWFAVDGLAPVIYQLSDTEVAIAWPYGMPGLTSTISLHQCFYIGVMNIAFAPGTPFLGVSNLFKRVGTNKLSVLLEYWSRDDSFGFPYCGLDPFHNKARIPAYIGAPQYPGKEDVYRKSNGELVSLSSVVGRQYLMRTAFLPEEIHWPTNVALSHESIRVTDERYDIMVKKNGQYDINWPADFEPILAPALVKLDQSGIPDSSANGCGCIDFVNCTDVDLVAMCDIDGVEHQIEVVTSCAPEDLTYLVTYELIGASTSVSPTGLVTIIPGIGVNLPSLTHLSTVLVTCGVSSCEIKFYSIVFPCTLSI